jgi:hypothetical protein
LQSSAIGKCGAEVDKVTGITKDQMVAKHPFRLDYNWLGQLSTEKFSKMIVHVRTNKQFLLYGVGVYVGLPETEEKKNSYCSTYFNETVIVNIDVCGYYDMYKSEYPVIKSETATQQIYQPSSSGILNIMFKTLVKNSKFLRITTDFGISKLRPVTTQNVCIQDINHHNHACMLFNFNEKSSCLAYLLCDIKNV